MRPKAKRNHKNGFYYYMLDFRAKKEAEGHVFLNGLQDVRETAGFFWKGLDPVTKRHYENMTERAKVAGNGGVKYTTHGQTYEEVERERLERIQKAKDMSDAIDDTVRCRGREGLAEKRLYFIHVNYYCEQDNGDYVPCELALLAYSIREGYLPQNIYHTFINPGAIPNGYSFKAKCHSAKTHKTPLPPRALGTGDFWSIYDRIMQLVKECGDLEDNGRPPPFFTMNQTMEVVTNVLQTLKNFAPPSSIKDELFRVYSIEDLFFKAKNFGLKPEGERIFINGIEDKGFLFISTAKDMLKNDLYDFAAGITCDFHEEQDVRQHCSRSFVVRWSYIFSDHLCTNLDVTMAALRHAPRGTNLNAKVITNQMSRLSVVPGAGRGKLAEGQVAPVGRTRVPGAGSGYSGSPFSGSVYSGSDDRRSRAKHYPPITIIDHGRLNDAASVASGSSNRDHPPITVYDHGRLNDAASVASGSSNRDHHPPITVYDHGRLRDAGSVASGTSYQDNGAASIHDGEDSDGGWKTVSRSKSTAYGSAPLRLPKGTGRVGSRTPVASLPDDNDYFNPTGVGRGRGLKKK